MKGDVEKQCLDWPSAVRPLQKSQPSGGNSLYAEAKSRGGEREGGGVGNGMMAKKKRCSK